MRFLIVLVSSVLALHTGIAYAQKTLGEILDQGAKKLSAEEFKSLVSGATISGTTLTGFDFSTKYSPDGTHSGSAQNMQGSSGISGTWKIDDSGKLCGQTQSTRSNTPAPSVCAFWFKVADRYFTSPSDADRSASIAPRAVKR